LPFTDLQKIQSIYRKTFNDDFSNIITSALLSLNKIILPGDCNVNYDKNDTCEFKSLLAINGFKQLIKEKTRTTQQSSTLIDIIATTSTNTIKLVDVIQTTFSDHDMVGCIRKINFLKYPAKCVKTRDFRNYDSQKLNDDVKNADWSPVYNSTNINYTVELFNNTLLEIFNRNAPYITKKIKGRPCPWDYHRNLLNEHKHQPKTFWNIIKKLFPTKRISSVSTAEKQEKAYAFSNYFATIIKKLKTTSFALVDFIWKKPSPILPKTLKAFNFNYVSTVFVRKQLKRLKRKKATGVDELTTSMLKDCAEAVTPVVTHIINMSLKVGTFPSLWKQARVIPIHKSGSVDTPGNYRPISVLPVLSKIIERVAQVQLMDFLETNNLINAEQFGYRKNRSTEEAAVKLCDDIRNFANDGLLTGAIFIDLSRAFDTISHSTLTDKLRSYGVRGMELNWFKCYLFGRSQYVDIGGVKSKAEPVLSGVPQGSILGPLLFLIFYNDLKDCLHHATPIMYADDTVLYYAHKDINVINKYLNKDMECLSEFCNKNELILNMKSGKTEAMLFGTAKRVGNKELTVKYRGKVVNVTERYVYLGNVLDRNLTLNENFHTKFRKAAGRVNLLKKIRPLLTEDAVKKIFDMMIVPLFTYCGNLQLVLTKTQQQKLCSLENRVSILTGTLV